MMKRARAALITKGKVTCILKFVVLAKCVFLKEAFK